MCNCSGAMAHKIIFYHLKLACWFTKAMWSIHWHIQHQAKLLGRLLELHSIEDRSCMSEYHSHQSVPTCSAECLYSPVTTQNHWNNCQETYDTVIIDLIIMSESEDTFSWPSWHWQPTSWYTIFNSSKSTSVNLVKEAAFPSSSDLPHQNACWCCLVDQEASWLLA